MELILNVGSVKILVDEKRHIRFGTWSAADIEVYFLKLNFLFKLVVIPLFWGKNEKLDL